MPKLTPAQRSEVRSLQAAPVEVLPAAALAPALLASLRAEFATAPQGAKAEQAKAFVDALVWDQIACCELQAARGVGGGTLQPIPRYVSSGSGSSVAGEQYYVSSVHPNRSDLNPGTDPEAPWATLDRVKTAWPGLQPGDTVHMARGSTFLFSWGAQAPWWVISHGGSAAGPVTLRGDDYGAGELPVLQRSGGSGWGSTIVVVASYVTLRDFIIDGASAGTTGVSIGGGFLTADIVFVQALNLRLRNLGNNSGDYSCGVEAAGFHGYKVSDCLIQGCDASEYTGHGFNHYPEKNGAVNNSANYRVIWRGNRARGARPSVWAGCGAGMHYAFGGADNLVEGNVIEGSNPAGGFMIMNCSRDEDNFILRKNWVKENPASNGIVVLNDHGGAQNTYVTAYFYSNLVSSSKYAGLSFECDNAIFGTVQVFNNTFVNNRLDPAGIPNNGGAVFIPNINTGLTVNLRNNLIVQTTSAAPAVCVSGSTFAHDHNLYWRAGGGIAVYAAGAQYTYAGLVAGWEPTAVVADPLIDAAFSLLAGSPAIGRGTALFAGHAVDYVGADRGAVWDLGAYEYGGLPPAPSPDPPVPPGGGETVYDPRTRPLTTFVSNTIAGAGLDSEGRVVLAPGVYWVEAWAAAAGVGAHRLALVLGTGESHAGSSAFAGAGQMTVSTVARRLVLAALTPVALVHYAPSAAGAATDGGLACDLPGQPEIYAAMMIRRIQ